MTIKDQFATSLVKGIGRTAGTIIVFGLMGTAWYVYGKTIVKNVSDYKNRYFIKYKSMDANKNDTLAESKLDFGKSTCEKETNTSDDIQEVENEVNMEDMEDMNEEFMYRQIFDKI
jgi:hypothetical protein